MPDSTAWRDRSDRPGRTGDDATRWGDAVHIAPDEDRSDRFRQRDAPTVRFEIEVVGGEMAELLAAEQTRAVREVLMWTAEPAASNDPEQPGPETEP